MIKIIHTADIHLGMENYGRTDARTGLNERLGDFLKSFDTIIDYAIKNKVDLFLFAGDAFKTREPGPTYEEAFAQRIQKLSEAKIPTLLLVGNHDLPGALGKANTLDIYKTLRIENVIVSRQPELIKINKLQIITLPWLSRSQIFKDDIPKTKTISELNLMAAEKLKEKVNELIKKTERQKPLILVAHYSVEGAVFGAEREVMLGADMVLPKNIIDKKIQYIGLGHIHKHQILSFDPLTAYSGSIERVDFGEEKEKKGFMEITIDDNLKTKYKFHELATRLFLTITIKIEESESDPMAKIEKEIKKHDLKNAIVKIVINIPEEKSSEIRELPIRELLREAKFIAGIAKNIKKHERSASLHEYHQEHGSFSPSELMEKYLIKKEIKGAYKEKLLGYAKKLMEEFYDTN